MCCNCVEFHFYSFFALQGLVVSFIMCRLESSSYVCLSCSCHNLSSTLKQLLFMWICPDLRASSGSFYKFLTTQSPTFTSFISLWGLFDISASFQSHAVIPLKWDRPCWIVKTHPAQKWVRLLNWGRVTIFLRCALFVFSMLCLYISQGYGLTTRKFNPPVVKLDLTLLVNHDISQKLHHKSAS